MRTCTKLFSIGLWLQDRIRGLVLKKIVIDDFKASNGWSDRWKVRNSVLFKTVSNELRLSTLDMTVHWNEMRLLSILSRYRLQGIFNADEFGYFFEALPNNTLELKGENALVVNTGKSDLLEWVRRILRVISYQYLSFEKPKIWDVSKTWCPHRVWRRHK